MHQPRYRHLYILVLYALLRAAATMLSTINTRLSQLANDIVRWLVAWLHSRVNAKRQERVPY